MGQTTPRHAELEGRTALVTGAGRGIGRAIALGLAARGAETILVGRDAGRLEEVRDRIQSESGVTRTIPTDIRDSEWLEELARGSAVVDVLVHNAAGFARYASVERVPEDEIEAVFDTTLLAATRLTAALIPGMKERGFGRIVHVGSMAGSLGARGQLAYATAKAGLAGLTRSTALEGGPFGVTANLLELGLFDTERVRDAVSDATRKSLVHGTPVGRMGRPEEVAATVAFLVGPDAAFLTGTVLPLNGGLGLGLPTGPGS